MGSGEPITLRVEKNQTITIKSDGSVLVGIHDIGVKVDKDDTLTLVGSGQGSRIDIDRGLKFLPRIQLMTEEPVSVSGSFGLSGDSIQSVLVDTNPIELTAMAGADSRKMVANSDKSEGAPAKITKYSLSTPEAKLTENKKGAGSYTSFKEGAKIFQFGSSDKRTVIVESGARVDFVNGKEDSKQMFTLLGSDTPETIENRFRIARGEAMNDVQRTLDLKNFMSAAQFAREKDKYGIADVQAQGIVEHRSAGRVNLSIPAALPFGRSSSAPVTGEGSAKSTTDASDPELNAKRLQVKNGIDELTSRYTTKTYGLLLTGGYDNDVKGGKDLAVLLGNVKKQTAEAISEDGSFVSKPKLMELHKNLGALEDRVDQISSDAVERMKKLNKIPKGQENNPGAWDTKNIPGWMYLRMNEMKADVKKVQDSMEGTPSLSRKAAYSVGMVETSEKRSVNPFDRLALLGELPKLAVADAGKLPEAMESAIPSIVGFLKGKSGKGAA